MNVPALLLFVLATLVQAVPGDESVGTLRGVIADPDGGPIDAYILIHKDPVLHPSGSPMPPDTFHTADKKGQLQVQLMLGYYDVCIMYSGFSPTCHKVRIRPGRVTALEVNMQFDKAVATEFGTRYPR